MTRWARAIGWGLLVGGLSSIAAARETTSSVATEAPIELPKFEVRDTRALPPPESWRYATIPNFEILSNASDHATQRLIRDFEMFREALNVVWPLPKQYDPPGLMILCGRDGAFSRFRPARMGDPAAPATSLFLKGKNQNAIVIDLDTTVVLAAELAGNPQDTGIDSGILWIEHNKQLYREYVLYLLSQSEPRLPAWFEEGMAQIVTAVKFDRDFVEIAKIETPNDTDRVPPYQSAFSGITTEGTHDPTSGDVESDQDFDNALAQRALWPMGKLFSVTHDDREAQNSLGANLWGKQCYAFVHMCLFGENGIWRKPFTTFLARATQEPVTEAMFKECFHMSYARMGAVIRGYIGFPNYQTRLYTAKHGGLADPGRLALRDATPAEVGRIKGEALLLAGRKDEARAEFIAPYIRGERDPELLAELGLLEHEDGKNDQAHRFLTAAIHGNAHDPEAYRQLARMRFSAAMVSPGAPNHQFSAEQTKGITSLLARARKLPPPTPETYDLLAATWAQSAIKPQPSDAGLLVEGVRLYPQNLRLIYESAVVCADAGLVEAAHSLVDRGRSVASDPTAKMRFEQLSAALPPFASSGPASASGPTNLSGVK